MAVLSVPRPLQERLGDVATASLVEMLRQFEDDQEERREVQKEHLFQLLEERFLRHVAESEQRTRKEIADLRADLSKEITGVHKEITVQTRWIVAVMAAAAVLIPIMLRVMEAIIP